MHVSSGNEGRRMDRRPVVARRKSRIVHVIAVAVVAAAWWPDGARSAARTDSAWRIRVGRCPWVHARVAAPVAVVVVTVPASDGAVSAANGAMVGLAAAVRSRLADHARVCA